MAKYTMTLYEAITQENLNLFDFDYTLDSSVTAYISKETLEGLIIGKYLFYEIGYETISRFKHEFMIDYLTKLYEFSEEVSNYNKLYNMNLTTNKRTYHETKTIGGTKHKYDKPMSQTTQALNAQYATQSNTESENVTTDGYETLLPTSFYKEIKSEIRPYVLKFIDSLEVNFMGVF